MKSEKTKQESFILKNAVTNPVIISAVSSVVAIGVAATVYTTQRIRHNKAEKPKVENVVFENGNSLSEKDPYYDDNDLGYC